MLFLLALFIELLILFLFSRLLTRSLAQFFYKVSQSQTTTIRFLSILFFPGVLIHELSHFLVASLLFVPVGELEFMPVIEEKGVKLGSVEIGKTDIFRRSIIGVAPVLVGTIIIIGSMLYITSDMTSSLPSILKFGLLFYILFEIGNTMFSSKKDVEGAVELGLALLIIFTLLYFTDFRGQLMLINNLFSEEVISFIQKANMFLLVPIGIDFTLYILTKVVVRR